MKRIFKWVLRLFIMAVVLLIIFLLSLDSILRVMMEHNIRAQTGMNAEIGQFHLGLLEPVVTIKDLKLHNPPDFGGTPFLNIPEIHAEYDRAALKKGEIHVMLLRFNLGELDIVKNAAGKTNLFELGARPPEKKNPGEEFKKRTGLKFTSIDVLNVSIGKFKYIDLGNQKNSHEQQIGIEDWPMPSVKSEADLAGLGTFIYLRSDGFFDSLVDRKNSGSDILKLFGF